MLDQDSGINRLHEVGDLRRTASKPGVALLPEVRAEFVEDAPSDFTVVEGWLRLPHVPRHVDKVRSAVGVKERHLFLVPVDEVLPARFFTDDFLEPPLGAPKASMDSTGSGFGPTSGISTSVGELGRGKGRLPFEE